MTRIASAVLAMTYCAATALSAARAAETEPSPERPDPQFAFVEASFRAQFKDADFVKVERKEEDRKPLFNKLLLLPGHEIEVIYKLTVTDPLNKKFELVYDSSGTLLSSEKFRMTVDALPADVRAEIERQGIHADYTDPLEIRVEKGIYKISGKANSKKFSAEVDLKASRDEPVRAPVAVQPHPAPESSTPAPTPNAFTDRVEITPDIDGPFHELFKDAKVLSVDKREPSKLVINVISVGDRKAKYEVTLTDALNKKFRVVFTEDGHLFAADKYLAPIGNLPETVRKAIERQTESADPEAVVEVRVDHVSFSTVAEHEIYRVSGKVNGKKINVDVTIFPRQQ